MPFSRMYLSPITTDRTKWQERITDLKDLILKTQTQINAEVTTFLQAISRKPERMNSIHKDRCDLEMTGAFLGFIRSQGRLSTIDSCTGDVQVSYFEFHPSIQTETARPCATTEDSRVGSPHQ